jgi:uncharacterized protein YciI
MQYLVLAYDAKDSGARGRRAAAREAHLSLIGELKEAGRVRTAAAIQNDEGAAIGSVLICEFASRAELDEWLKREPYVTGLVWETIEVRPCQLGPFFNQ